MNTKPDNLLSNSNEILHFENDIQLTPLGETFHKNLGDKLGFEIVACTLTIHRENVCIAIKERGVPGGMFGGVAEHSSMSVLEISDDVCRIVWEALSAALDEHGMPSLVWYNQKENKPRRLFVSIYDFVQRSRFGYFADHAPRLESLLREKYPDVAFSLRRQEDFVYYLLIFHTEEDLNRAREHYGIEAMNRSVWEICRQDDRYHVFDEPIPMPRVTTLREVMDRGESMGIMRNNTEFARLLTEYPQSPQTSAERNPPPSPVRKGIFQRIFRRKKQ